MNLKSSFQQHVNVWLSVLFAVVGAAISIRFITGLPNALWWQSIYVFVAASGVFFIGHFLLQTLLVWPIGCLNAKAGKGAALLLTFLLLTALVTDTFVYQQYRFHLNWPMIGHRRRTRGVFLLVWDDVANCSVDRCCCVAGRPFAVVIKRFSTKNQSSLVLRGHFVGICCCQWRECL